MKKILIMSLLMGSMGAQANQMQKNLEQFKNMDVSKLHDVLSPESTDVIERFKRELEDNPDLINNPEAHVLLAAAAGGAAAVVGSRVVEYGFEKFGNSRESELIRRIDPRFFDMPRNAGGEISLRKYVTDDAPTFKYQKTVFGDNLRNMPRSINLEQFNASSLKGEMKVLREVFGFEQPGGTGPGDQ